MKLKHPYRPLWGLIVRKFKHLGSGDMQVEIRFLGKDFPKGFYFEDEIEEV